MIHYFVTCTSLEQLVAAVT